MSGNSAAIIFVIVLAVTLISLVTVGCTRYWRLKQLETTYDREPLLSEDRDFRRDSTLIAYAVERRETESARYYVSKNKTDHDLPDRLVDGVEVVDILYNEDKTRLVALATYKRIRSPLSDDFASRPMAISGQAVVGIRDNAEALWEIYPLQLTYVSNYDDWREAAIALRIEYFEGITGLKTFGIGQTTIESAEPVYNIDEDKFWDSVIWRKGVRLPDLYPFQVKQGIATRGELWIPIDPYVRDYPDHIRTMYG